MVAASTSGGRRRRRNLALAAAAVLAAAIAAAVLSTRAGRRGDDENVPTSAVKRGPVTISISQSGTIRAMEQEVISCMVEGQTTLIFLVEEGKKVRKGDLLVEMDASGLNDRLVEQEILVQNANAAHIRARENLAVTRSQSESDVAAAKLTKQFAEEDLKKYTEGEYRQQAMSADSKITLAEEELQLSAQKLEWSEKLLAESYLSKSECDSDRLANKRAKLNLEMARSEKNLLEQYTYTRQVAQLTSDVEQATRALERVILKTGADIVQAEADLKAREAELNQQRSREGKIRDQITKTRIEAPRDGLVVYATSVQAQNRFRGGSAPLEAGQTVRERQELIYLPTADQMTAEVQIHESNLNKLRIGLPAVVTVDALEGKTFMGKVTKIALLPDAGSMWMNPDLKVYSTQIVLDGLQPGLRTGMSCMAEIVVERHEDALCVPIQSVVKVDGEPTVYVKAKEGFEPARVEVGMDNGRIILVQSGVEEGQMVMLTPPLQAAAAPEKKELSNAVVAERLKAAERAPAGGGHEATRTPAQTEHQAEGGNGPAGPTPGQREEMRKHFESMTPEQREELRRQTAGRRGRRNQETE